MVLVASAGLEEPEGLVALVESAAGTVHRLCRPAAATGSTTPNIAVVPLIGTGRPRTGLVVRRAVIRLLTVRLVPGAKCNGRAAIWPATARGAEVLAIGPAEAVWAIERGEVPATGPEGGQVTEQAEGEGIASEAGMCPAVRAGTEMPSEAVLEDTTDRVLAPAATAVPRAWDLEAEAEVEAAVEAEAEAEAGGGKA